MSYDIYLKLNEDALLFSKRIADKTWYEVSDKQIFYENKDTGVYFIIDVLDELEDDVCVSIHINYCRPSCFIDEFMCEVKGWNLEGVEIYDPQIGDVLSTSSIERIVNQYQISNGEAFQSIGSQNHIKVKREVLCEIWKWNYNRSKLQNSVTDDMYVAIQFYMKLNGKFTSMVSWPNLIDAMLPKAEFILIFRKKKSFFGLGKESEEKIIVRMEDVLNSNKIKYTDKGRYVLFDSVNQDFNARKYVENLIGLEIELSGLPFELIKDE